jgi:hypothetical protein
VRPPVHLMVCTEWPHMSHRCTSWFVLNDRVSHRCTSRFVLNNYTWATSAPHGSYWMTTHEPPVHLTVRTEWLHVSHQCTSRFVLNDYTWATSAPHGSYWMTACHRFTSRFVLNDRVSHRCTLRFVLNDYTWATGAPHGSYWMTTSEPPVHLTVRTEWLHVSHRCTSRFVLNDYKWATGAPHGSYWMTAWATGVSHSSYRMTTCEPPAHLMVHTEWPYVSHRCTSWYILNDHMWATGVGHGSQSDRKLLYFRNQLNDAIKYLIVLPTDLALHLEDSWIQSWSHICTSICSSSNLKCDLAASYQIYYNQKQSWFLSTADTVLLTNNIKLRAFFPDIINVSVVRLAKKLIRCNDRISIRQD